MGEIWSMPTVESLPCLSSENIQDMTISTLGSVLTTKHLVLCLTHSWPFIMGNTGVKGYVNNQVTTWNKAISGLTAFEAELFVSDRRTTYNSITLRQPSTACGNTPVTHLALLYHHHKVNLQNFQTSFLKIPQSFISYNVQNSSLEFFLVECV